MAQGFDKFPEVDFGWLGRLPKISEEARERSALQGLGDLDLQTPKGLRDAAKKLSGVGTLKAMEQSTRYLNAATAIEESRRRGLADQLSLQFWKNYRPGAAPGAGAPGEAGVGSAPNLNLVPGSEGPWTNPPGSVPSGAPGPQSAIEPEEAPEQTVAAEEPPPALGRAGAPRVEPPPERTAFSTLPGPASPQLPPESRVPIPPRPGVPPGTGPAAISPSEAILAAAEDAPQAVEAPGPQLAQAGGGPIPGLRQPPAALPPGLDPATVAAAQAPRALGGQPASAPPPGVNPDQRQARLEAERVGQEMVKLFQQGGPKVVNTPMYRGLEIQFRNSMERMKLGEKEQSYTQAVLGATQRGEPIPSRDDWELANKRAGEKDKEAHEDYLKTHRPRGEQGRDLNSKLASTRQLINHPSFESGRDRGLVDNVRSSLAYMNDIVGNLGGAKMDRAAIDRMTLPTDLRMAYRSITRQAVTTMLGGLSKAISDGDRHFIEGSFESLMNTKQGNEIIQEFLQQSANRMIRQESLAREYMRSPPRGQNRADVIGMEDHIDKGMEPFRDRGILKSQDGKLTALGERLQKAVEEAERELRPSLPEEQSAAQLLWRMRPSEWGWKLPQRQPGDPTSLETEGAP